MPREMQPLNEESSGSGSVSNSGSGRRNVRRAASIRRACTLAQLYACWKTLNGVERTKNCVQMTL